MLLDDLWAKSPNPGMVDPPGLVGGKGYPLLPHLLDVAAAAMALLEQVPCPVPLPSSTAWLATLAGAHDLGKASPGFQAKLGAPFGQPGAPDRHDASTVPLLTEQLVQRGLARTEALTLANAVGAHHGSLISSTLVAAAGRWPFKADWREAHDQIMSGLIAGTGAEGIPALPPAGDVEPFLRWLMGLTTVADWIGSSDALCDWNRLKSWCGDASGWFEHSQSLARKALMDIGMAVPPLYPQSSGAEAMALALNGWLPRPLQKTVASVIDDLNNEPGLIVIEAPMGEGKSEAALGCACGRGLYMAMPTQATSNALYGRVAQFVSRAGKRPPPALAHSAGGPKAAMARLREIGLGTPDSSAQAGWWFKGSKRALLAADGIGTVDQALIGVLSARHHFVRLFGLAGRTVIFDELHAYDSYTGGLIERLCSWLQGLGCRVVLMSATLPSARRDSILHAWAGSEVKVPSSRYPRVTWARHGSVQSFTFSASRQQTLRIKGIAADEVAAQATKSAQCGGRVLVVVNKVRRAQEVFQELGQVPATLFHARFPMDERLEIERRVLQQFGPGGCCSGGHVLVATQVAEQSLDIDMDLLITDIAPVDLMLQRAGRIHRHQRLRPDGFEDPLILVAGLEQEIPPPELTSFIYDRWLVLRSAAWLQAHPQLVFPSDIDQGVQQVYGSEQLPALQGLAEAIQAAWPQHLAEEQQMAELARQATSEAAAPIDDEIADGGAQFGTRLGQDSQSIVPVTKEQLQNLGEFASFLSGHYLRISQRALIDYVRAQPWPPGWRDQPGLRHHRPMLVDKGGAAVGFNALFDPELGLVTG